MNKLLLLTTTLGAAALAACQLTASATRNAGPPAPTELAVIADTHFSSDELGSGPFVTAGVVNDTGTQSSKAVLFPPQGIPKSVTVTIDFKSKQGTFTVQLKAKAHDFAPGVSGGISSNATIVSATGAYAKFAGKKTTENLSIVSNPYEYLPAGVPKPAHNEGRLLLIFKLG